MKFPNITAENLEGRLFNLPQDLDGQLNITAIAFRQSQQKLIDQWVFYLNPLLDEYSELEFYEIPTLNRMYKIMRFIIDGGMRSGIPSRKTREHTITLYIDKSPFKQKLEISSENTIYVFLVNDNGDILWKAKGKPNSNKIENLKILIKNELKKGLN